MLVCTSFALCASLCKDIYLGIRIFKRLRKSQALFRNMFMVSHSYQKWMCLTDAPQFCQSFLWLSLFNAKHAKKCGVVSHCNSNLQFLIMMLNAFQMLICSLHFFLSEWKYISIQIFCRSANWVAGLTEFWDFFIYSG